MTWSWPRTAGAHDEQLQSFDLADLAARYHLDLGATNQAILAELPTAQQGPSGSTVVVAVEAKACMTAHIKAPPRLYDELTSSRTTVHGDNTNALAVGLVMATSPRPSSAPASRPPSTRS